MNSEGKGDRQEREGDERRGRRRLTRTLPLDLNARTCLSLLSFPSDTSRSPAVMNGLLSSSGRRGSTSLSHPNSSGNNNDGGASNPRTSQSSSLAPPTAFSASLTSLVSRGSDSDSDSPPPGNESDARPSSNLEISGVADGGSRLGRVSSKQSSKHGSSAPKLKGDAVRVQDEEGYVVSTRSRGMTDSVEIREHGCVFKHRIDSAVQIGVTSHKDGAQVLEEKILRLVVHEVSDQETIWRQPQDRTNGDQTS